MPVYIVISSSQRHRCNIILNILDSKIKLSGEKYNVALVGWLVEMQRTRIGRPWMPIRIHKTAINYEIQYTLYTLLISSFTCTVPLKMSKKCCLQAIQFIRGKNNSPSMSSIAHSSHMDIFQVTFLLLHSVLRIHDILGWIRIRGSIPLTNGSGFGSGSWIRILLFSSLTFKMPAKNEFFDTIFSAYYFLKVHLHHFSKIKSEKE